MPIYWYLFLVGGGVTLVDGLVHGNISYILGGVGMIAIFYFMWRSHVASVLSQLLRAEYPGSAPRIERASDAAAATS